jgi:hypothetical protein
VESCVSGAGQYDAGSLISSIRVGAARASFDGGNTYTEGVLVLPQDTEVFSFSYFHCWLCSFQHSFSVHILSFRLNSIRLNIDPFVLYAY